MARLTQSMRHEFVRAVMADVPQINYVSLISARVNAMRAQHHHELVLALWDRPDLRKFVKKEIIQVSEFWVDVLPALKTTPTTDDIAEDPEVIALCTAHDEQAAKRRELTAQLQGAAERCGTTDKLAKLLPDFVKYIPDHTPAPSYPVAVADLTESLKAAGWPKEPA